MVLFTRRNKKTDNRIKNSKINREHNMQHKLPKDYDGAFKILGKDVEVVTNLNHNSNTLVIGAPGSGKNYCYIDPNLKYANKDSNFLIRGIKIDVDHVKELLPGYDVIELNLDKHPIDYFKLITNEEEAAEFVKVLCKVNQTRNRREGQRDEFFEQLEMKVMINEVMRAVKKESCSYDEVTDNLRELQEICDAHLELKNRDEALALEFFYQNKERLYINAPKMLMNTLITCKMLLEDLMSDNETNITEIIDKLRTQDNIAVVVTRSLECDLYSILFMNFFIKQYRKQYFANESDTRIVKVILDEASMCYIDTGLCVLARTCGMSIDYLIQCISQLKEMYPQSWYELIETLIKTVQTVICLGTRNFETIRFINEIAELPKGFNIQTMSLEQELIYDPTISNKWIVAKKATIE